MPKRGIVISDAHCGHVCGLTPPDWQTKQVKGSTTKRNKWARLQAELWAAYVGILRRCGPFDFGLSAGDSIDGTGSRSGATELITADRQEQGDMAVAVHDEVRKYARPGFQWVGVYGTGYHTGDAEDWENRVAAGAKFAKIGSHEWINVNGCIIDLKHHVGSSSVPHGRHTAVAREHLWATMWAERSLVPQANIILRGHVHYHAYSGGPGWVAMTLPALQGMGTKYGSRRCSGVVDWGVVIIDVDDDGSFDWHAETVQIQAQRARAVRL